jgi:hypothetical protein
MERTGIRFIFGGNMVLRERIVILSGLIVGIIVTSASIGIS